MNKEEKLRDILCKLDWIQILDTATKRRKTSWNFGGYEHPVVEWRNASDEVCMAVVNALEDKGILEDMYSRVKRIEATQNINKVSEGVDGRTRT